MLSSACALCEGVRVFSVHSSFSPLGSGEHFGERVALHPRGVLIGLERESHGKR